MPLYSSPRYTLIIRILVGILESTSVGCILVILVQLCPALLERSAICNDLKKKENKHFFIYLGAEIN